MIVVSFPDLRSVWGSAIYYFVEFASVEAHRLYRITLYKRCILSTDLCMAVSVSQPDLSVATTQVGYASLGRWLLSYTVSDVKDVCNRT